MKYFWTFLDKTQTLMKAISSICLMGMCLMTCSDIFLRSTINKPIFGSEEIVSIFAVMAIGFALPYAHRKDSHVGVEILVRLFSRRKQKLLRVVTNVFSFLLFIVLSWKMFTYAEAMQTSGEVSMNLELPMYYFVYALSFALFIVSLCILQDILQFFRSDREKT